MRYLVVVAALVLVPLPAFAQYAPQYAPPPSHAPTPNGEYVAPLQQQTQPMYVPQSVAISGPRQITTWQEGEPIPPGYHPVQRIRRGLVGN